uniref:hypothetical protein n=1 Tax=Sphingomonas populi TaxID=2484750 RepID=UPI0013EED1AD|nr:hypothetical protein [Sphingomonas populi]
MLRSLSSGDPINTVHCAKLAYVYVRQSSVGQIRHHQESTALQYRLEAESSACSSPRWRRINSL